MADLIEFGGETFAPSEQGIPLAALMRFAHVAKAGTDANDIDGLDALYRLLSKCIAPDDWERFLDTAEKTYAKGDDLMAVAKEVISGATKRPTSRPSDSSAGPLIVAPSSGADDSGKPYLRVVRREEESGRPDRALMVLMAQESMASAG